MPDPGDTAAGDRGVNSSNWGGGGGNYASIGGGQGSGASYGGGSATNTGSRISGGTSSNWGGSNNSSSLGSAGNSNGRGGSWGGSNNSGVSGNYNSSGPRGPESSWGTRGSPSGGALSSGNLSKTQGSGNIGGALSAGLGGEYSNPISLSSSVDTGYYHTPMKTLPGMNNPTQFDKGIYQSNLVNVYGNPMETWSGAYDPNRLTPGAQKIHQSILDNALRLGAPVDYFSGRAGRSVGTSQHPAGQAIDIRINDPITGKPVGYDQIGQAAYNPIASVRPGYRTPAQAARIAGALEQPYRDFAAGVIGGFYNNPGVYGPFDNQRWGGAFETGAFSKDYMHFDEGKISPGVSRSQQQLRQMAQGTQMPTGPLSSPAPTQLAMAGMGGGLFNMARDEAPVAASPPALNQPYSNIGAKGNLQPTAPAQSSQYAGYGNFNVPVGGPQGVQQTYNVPGGAGVVAMNNLTFGPPTPPAQPQVVNVVPSYEQSTYTGPIQTVMSEPDVPSVPPSQEGEPIPYPGDPNDLGYKIWRGGTYVADALLPGGGSLLRNMDDTLRERWATMTNDERQALMDQWDRNNSYGTQSPGNVKSGPSEGPKRGGDSVQLAGLNTPTSRVSNVAPAVEPSSSTWKQDALAYGFTPEQLKDPETAAYIKSLWEMGWIPNSA